MTEPAEHAASSSLPALSTLSKKIGPFPGYVWVAIAVAGYVAYTIYRKSHPSTTTPPTTPGTDPASTPTVPKSTTPRGPIRPRRGTDRERLYVVKHGDTLQTIAIHFYGSSSAWHRISGANGGITSVRQGQEIIIPL